MDWKTIDKISEETGLSAESLRALKKRGILREKIHWVKAPNGRIFLNLAAVENWITNGNSYMNRIGEKKNASFR